MARAKKSSKKTIKAKAKTIAKHNPASDAHKTLLRLVAKGVVAAERVGAKAAAAEKDVERALRKAQQAARRVSIDPNAAAKRAAGAAKKQAARARDLFNSLQRTVRSEEQALKHAVQAAESERGRERAKKKAVAAFARNWEKDYRKRQTAHKAAT